MDQYTYIRTAHRVYGKSIREIARETGHNRKTVRKVLNAWPLAKINPFMLAGIDPLVAQRMTGWEKGENRLPEQARAELARA